MSAARELAVIARTWAGFLWFWWRHRRCAGLRRYIDEDAGFVGFICMTHSSGISFGRPRVSCSADGCEPDTPCPSCSLLAGLVGGTLPECS